MPALPTYKRSFWSWPVDDGFILGLRDAPTRVSQSRRLERERWVILGLFLFCLAIQMIPVYWDPAKWDSVWLLVTCIIFFVWMQDNRCRSYIVGVAELFDKESEGTVTGQSTQSVTG